MDANRQVELHLFTINMSTVSHYRNIAKLNMAKISIWLRSHEISAVSVAKQRIWLTINIYFIYDYAENMAKITSRSVLCMFLRI